MKKSITISTLILYSCCVFSQTVEILRIKGSEVADFVAKTGYKYPAYTKAKAYFKNGDVASGRFNFDYFLQEMKYLGEKGDTLAITNMADIKYIAFPADTFFYDKGYLEWAASSATARLAIKTEFKLADRQSIGAFGTTNPGVKIDNFVFYREGFNTLQLQVNEEYVFLKRKTYYISPIDESFALVSKKNISRIFPKKDIENYIKENKINLNKEADLVDLFVYANKPK